jgi:hypothetical protein
VTGFFERKITKRLPCKLLDLDISVIKLTLDIDKCLDQIIWYVLVNLILKFVLISFL